MALLRLAMVVSVSVAFSAFGGLAHAASSCRAVLSTEAKAVYAPIELTRSALAETLAIVKQKKAPEAQVGIRLSVEPNKHGLFKALYETGFIEANRMSQLLGDKLIQAKVLEQLLGHRHREFSPRGIGLKEFLVSEKIVDSSGSVVRTAAEIASAIDRVFPDGVVLKPIESQASDGVGMLTKTKQIAELLAAQSAQLYEPSEFHRASPGNLSGVVLSGERFFMMDKIKGSVLDGKSGRLTEFRVHALNGFVLDGAIIPRWYDSVPASVMAQVKTKTQELLDLLPKSMTRGQAYSFDVITLDNGGIQLVEINTNRGKFKNTWSGFTVEPKVLKAHVVELETRYGWKFEGPAGELLRSGLANVRRFIKESYQTWEYDIKRGESQPHEMVADLKAHLSTLVDPLLQKLEPMPRETWSNEARSEAKFARSYADPIKRVSSYGDEAWRELVAWMEPQIQ